ncbi:MAG: hypothetical protein PHV53_04280 [Fermentimonas sp.]|nr:hypothetical protein [Fermentimonas sp.]
MRKILIVLMFTCLSSVFINVNAQNPKSILGEWKYSVNQAPYGYDRGVISFKEVEKKLTGDVTFDSGYKVNLQSVAFKNDTLKAGVNVEGEYVTILSHVKGKKIEGTVDTSMGKMNLTAERLKQD